MRHYLISLESPDLPITAFRKALGKNRPATLEGGKGGGAPAAPDPYAVADAQTIQNRNTAAYNKALNLGNYTNPFGSQVSQVSGYDPNTGAPIYHSSVVASPELQALLMQEYSGINGAKQNYQSGVNRLPELANQYSGLNSQLGSLNSQLSNLDASGAMKKGQDAYYRSATAYLDPQYAQQKESLEAKLAAQGLAPGSQAYQNALGNFQRDKDFAYNQAANSAITQGQQLGLNQLQAQQGIIGQRAGLFGQQGANLGQIGSLADQQISASQLPYSNLSSIASLIPGYNGVGSAGANSADIAGAMNNQYQGQLGAYNARQQSNNATMSTLGTLGAVGAMMFF